MSLRKLLLTISLAVLVGLAGCTDAKIPGIYRQNIQQGNAIEKSTLAQVKLGMSKRQVRYLLGTPMVVDLFNPDRWDYVYEFIPHGGKVTEKRVTLLFHDDRLAHIGGDVPHSEPGAKDNANATTVVTVPPRKPSSSLFDWLNPFSKSD